MVSAGVLRILAPFSNLDPNAVLGVLRFTVAGLSGTLHCRSCCWLPCCSLPAVSESKGWLAPSNLFGYLDSFSKYPKPLGKMQITRNLTTSENVFLSVKDFVKKKSGFKTPSTKSIKEQPHCKT